MRRILVLVINMVFFSCVGISQVETYSKNEVLEDIEFLKTNLLSLHPNLYTYSPKTVFDSFYNNLDKSIPNEVTEFETYSIISSVSSIIKDGHTLFLPEGKKLQADLALKKYFPFKILWDGKNMFIEKNYSQNSELTEGTIINSINGISTTEIISFMLDRMMHDGDNLTYPIWVINNHFNIYYSFFYGHFKSFNIQTKKGKYETEALDMSQINEAKERKYSAYYKSLNNTDQQGITLEIIDSINTAFLTIKDFHKSTLKDTYNQKFNKSIRKIFQTINQAKVTTLILDIRDNQGGKIKYGKILLSNLLTQPFKIVDEYRIVNKHTNSDDSKRTKSIKGPQMGSLQPKQNGFKNQLYVITNGGSFSNSGIIASVLQKYKRGYFVGEETGGSSYILAGSIKAIELPNSKIKVEIPTLQFVLRKGNNQNCGAMPDKLIEISVSDASSNKDVIYEYLIKIISEKEKL